MAKEAQIDVDSTGSLRAQKALLASLYSQLPGSDAVRSEASLLSANLPHAEVARLAQAGRSEARRVSTASTLCRAA
jgi:uncharacterized iron-regulated protein